MKESGGLRNFFTVIFKYKHTILWLWGITILTIFVTNQIIPPTYEAESTIMVNFGREYLYNPEVGSHTPYNYYDRIGQINSEIEILSSRELIEEVIENLGIDTLYPEGNETVSRMVTALVGTTKSIFGAKDDYLSADTIRLNKAKDLFMEDLTILGGKDSNVIRVSFQNRDPEIAKKTVNLLVDLYQKKHLEMFRDQRVSGFLEDMVKQYKGELDTAEQKLDSYRIERAANSIELQEEMLIKQKENFDTMLKQRESELVGLIQRLASLQKQISSMAESTPIYSETTERDRVIDNSKAELLSLQLKEQELLGTYKESSTQVANVRARIKLVESFLGEQEKKSQATVRVGKSMAYQELEREIAMTTANKQELSAMLESLRIKGQEIDAALNDYQSGEQQMKILERQKNLKEKNYLIYVEKLEEARINMEMDNKVLTNIKIVHRASTPYLPIKPQKLLNLIVGFVLGGFAGIGIAFFRNHVDQGVNIPEDLEKRLKLPVLATVCQKR